MENARKLFTMLVVIVSFVLIGTVSHAAIPHLINYQGKLTDSAGKPLEGSQSIAFRIYDAESGGSLLWQETQAITTQKGIFSCLLGGVTALNLPFDKPYFLGIQVGSDPEMAPRQRLASSAYAFAADNTNNVSGVVAVGNGGTGQTTANAALNALLPSQGSSSGKILGTNGSSASWVAGGLTTGWVCVYDGLKSGNTDIVITGLNGNADRFYKIYMSGNYNNSHIYVQMNNDTTIGNYLKIGAFKNFVAMSPANVAGMVLLVNPEQYGNGNGVIEATMGAISGYKRVCMSSCSSETYDRHMGIEALATQWTNTADNITQITVKGDFTGRVVVFAMRTS